MCKRCSFTLLCVVCRAWYLSRAQPMSVLLPFHVVRTKPCTLNVSSCSISCTLALALLHALACKTPNNEGMMTGLSPVNTVTSADSELSCFGKLGNHGAALYNVATARRRNMQRPCRMLDYVKPRHIWPTTHPHQENKVRSDW